MRESVTYTILDAKAANGAGNAIFCRDFRHVMLFIATDGGADAALTVKFQGSIGKGKGANMDVAPDFGSAQAVDNMWDYIEVVDLEDGSAIDGDTGIAVATADDYRVVVANIDGLDYINAIVSGRTEGEVTVVARLYND